MAYTTSGQIPVGQSFKLGDYTFNLAVNPTGVIATVNDGEKGAAKGASFRNPQIKSWSVEANESEASVYVQFANEPDTYPDYISIIQQPYKLTYKDGESVNIDGIIVRGYNADGSIWDGYSDGIIPNNEIIIQSVEEHNDKTFYIANSSLLDNIPVYYTNNTMSLDSYYESHNPDGGYLIEYEHDIYTVGNNVKLALLRYYPTPNYPIYAFFPIYTSFDSKQIQKCKRNTHRDGYQSYIPKHFEEDFTYTVSKYDEGFRPYVVNEKIDYEEWFYYSTLNGYKILDDGTINGTIYKTYNNTIPYIDVPSNLTRDDDYKYLRTICCAMWFNDDGSKREEHEIYHSATVTILWQGLTASFPIVIKKEIEETGGEENG